MENRLIKVGVFYDGSFFSHVSNYYAYSHFKKQRISITGLHHFIVNEVSKHESSGMPKIVESHYFRGRLSASEANSRNSLMNDRVFEEVLMRERIQPHYLAMTGNYEKGVDVNLSLEAFDLTITKQLDIVVLIAGDGDYVPLVRKLSSIGAKVMLLGWNFEHHDVQDNYRYTKTSDALVDECYYPYLMDEVINKGIENHDEFIDGLFVYKDSRSKQIAQKEKTHNRVLEKPLSSANGNTASSKEESGKEGVKSATKVTVKKHRRVVPPEKISSISNAALKDEKSASVDFDEMQPDSNASVPAEDLLGHYDHLQGIPPQDNGITLEANDEAGEEKVSEEVVPEVKPEAKPEEVAAKKPTRRKPARKEKVANKKKESKEPQKITEKKKSETKKSTKTAKEKPVKKQVEKKSLSTKKAPAVSIKGSVVSISATGSGILEDESGDVSNEIHFHKFDVKPMKAFKEMIAGDKVSFDVQDCDKGLCAKNVRLL